MSKGPLVTFPAAKGILVDQYAQISRYDAAENQRLIERLEAAERKKKADMKKALDEQASVHETAVRESGKAQWLREQVNG